MVQAIVDFNEADYDRLRKAAGERGMTVELFIADQAVRAATIEPNQPSAAEASDTCDPAAGLVKLLERAKREGWSANGPFLTDDEMYTR